MLKITICGGGNLGSVCTGFLASQPEAQVSLLTRRPEQWSLQPEVIDPDGHCFTGTLSCVTSDAREVIPEADIVLLCLPGFSIEAVLQEIRPWLSPATAVGAIVANTGFFFAAHDLLPASQPLFGFQRVPFISRISTYGHRAQLLGYKPQLHVAIEHADDPALLRLTLEQLFRTPVALLNNFYEVSLSNSNPILHTGRLFTMWRGHEQDTFPAPFLFYDDWTLEASEMIMQMDAEFMQLTGCLDISQTAIPPLLTYYESVDAASLTRKIRTIQAFHGIQAPMTETPDGWRIDFTSRYFIEDFPFGLRFIRDLLRQHHIPAPFIEQVYQWGVTYAAR